MNSSDVLRHIYKENFIVKILYNFATKEWTDIFCYNLLSFHFMSTIPALETEVTIKFAGVSSEYFCSLARIF